MVIDSNGQLGTVSSSRTVKRDIEDMGDTTETVMGLRPVRFRYKVHGDGGPVQYGLIAEEVAEVAPEEALLDAQRVARYLLHSFRDRPAMLRRQCKRLQDQQVERTLRKFDSVSHMLPFHFYRKYTWIPVEAQGEISYCYLLA